MNSFISMRFATAASLAVLLSACGGSKDNQQPVAKNMSRDTGVAWQPSQGTFDAKDPDRDTLSIAAILQNGVAVTPTEGIYRLKNALLSVDGLGFVLTPLSGDAVEFTYTVSDGKKTASADFKQTNQLQDPLIPRQWHLRNTGQSSDALSDALFQHTVKTNIENGMNEEEATTAAKSLFDLWKKTLVPGEDLNVIEAYHLGVSGQNARVVVVDTGLEIVHEDLQQNIVPGRSVNFIEDASDATDPTSTSVDGDHGTAVAGLIAGARGNFKGGQGVAPEAQLIGMNLLAVQGDLPNAYSHGVEGSGISTSEPIAVFNRSYGFAFPLVMAYNEIDEELHKFSATKLRDGKGAVNIKAVGNGFSFGDPSADGDFCYTVGSVALNLSCYNANMEAANASPYYFGIGAVNTDGKHSSYSNAGANLLAVAPAGEFGDLSPAMLTTDQSGCDKGLSSDGAATALDETKPGYSATAFPFNHPGHPENPDCNYFNTFNGTSAAAPNAAGVVALVISANPALTYRDVKHILISTATKVDPSDSKVSLTAGDGDFVAHSGWTKNKAGFEFNNLYGFGRLNAGKAVAMAKNFKSSFGDQMVSDWKGLGIYGQDKTALTTQVPDNSIKGTEFSITIDDNHKLEAIQFKFTIANPEFEEIPFIPDDTVETWPEPTLYHSTAGADLAIEVTSPAGTRSVLLTSKQAILVPASTGQDFFSGYILKDAVMLSNAFYGESSKGTWKIKVLDVNGSDIPMTGGTMNTKGLKNNQTLSTVQGVAIRTFGHQ